MTHVTPRKGSAVGFTLIELLVVIAIIAILAAILFPVFAKAREKARQTTCLSDAKQIGLGVTQYYQDYDETTPNGNYYYHDTGGWAGQIQPYVKSVEAFRCPDDTKVVAATDKAASFGMNQNFGTATGNLSQGKPNVSVSISAMNAPASTVMLFEVEGSTGIDISQLLEGPYTKNFNGSAFGNGYVGNNSPSGGGTFTNCGAPGTLKYATGYMGQRDTTGNPCQYTGPTGRHSDGSNFLMADCHAKWLRGAQVSSGGNAAQDTDSEDARAGYPAAGTNGNLPNGVKCAVTFSIK